MKLILSKILDRLGFEIYRKSRKKKIQFPKDQKPVYIEFLGVPAVGKSTIFEALQKKEKFWVTLNEYNTSLGKKKNQNANPGENSVYQQLAERRWENLNNKNYLPADKLRVAYWNYVILKSDALLHQNIENSVVLSDEGFVLSFSDAILEMEKEDPQSIDEFLKNRAFIYCTAKPEVILNRIENQKRTTGKVVAQHKTTSNQKLMEIIKLELEEREKLIRLLKNKKRPLLVIDTTDKLDSNLKKILTFIQEFCRTNKT